MCVVPKKKKKEKWKSATYSVLLNNNKHHADPGPPKAEIAKTGYAWFK